jgi:hypothetical protein
MSKENWDDKNFVLEQIQKNICLFFRKSQKNISSTSKES